MSCRSLLSPCLGDTRHWHNMTLTTLKIPLPNPLAAPSMPPPCPTVSPPCSLPTPSLAPSCPSAAPSLPLRCPLPALPCPSVATPPPSRAAPFPCSPFWKQALNGAGHSNSGAADGPVGNSQPSSTPAVDHSPGSRGTPLHCRGHPSFCPQGTVHCITDQRLCVVFPLCALISLYCAHILLHYASIPLCAYIRLYCAYIPLHYAYILLYCAYIPLHYAYIPFSCAYIPSRLCTSGLPSCVKRSLTTCIWCLLCHMSSAVKTVWHWAYSGNCALPEMWRPHVMTCHVMSCHVMSCHVMSELADQGSRHLMAGFQCCLFLAIFMSQAAKNSQHQ